MGVFIFGVLIAVFLGSLMIYLKLTTIIRERIVEQYSSMADVDPSEVDSGCLSIIIPVYNEEGRITECCESVINALQGYRGRWELILVDDESTDLSLNLLRKFVSSFEDNPNVKLLSSGRSTRHKCNENWVGKSLPCHIGFENSRGRYLLFLDADVRLEPGSLRNLLAQVMVDKTGFLSVIPKIDCNRLFSWAFYPLAVICQILTFDFIRKNPHKTYPYASGQMMIFERHSYEVIGGFEAISDNVCQDVRAARKAKACGLKQKHILGFNLAFLNTDMSFFDVVKSFSKSILVAVEYDIPKVLIMPFIMILIAWFPYYVILVEVAGLILSKGYANPELSLTAASCALAISTVLIHFLSLHQFQVMVKNRRKLISLYPFGGLMFLLISCHSLFTSCWGNKKHWKWKDRRILPDG